EDGIRDRNVTGVQTCALPIWRSAEAPGLRWTLHGHEGGNAGHSQGSTYGAHCGRGPNRGGDGGKGPGQREPATAKRAPDSEPEKIGRASCRERVKREEEEVRG